MEAASPTVEAPQPARAAAWEWALLGVLCAAMLCFWVAHYHRFILPNADYIIIQRTGNELWSGSLPSNYKRAPAFPLLMGLVAHAIPAERPLLEAALCLNIAFSLGSLVLLFIFVRRLLGWTAIVPVAVYATLHIFQESALAPLIEPSMGFFILLTFVLWQRRSRWQYAAAFAAALTRYEAAALIPICFALNVAEDRRVLKHVLLAAAASSGLIVWMVLSVTHSTLGNPYLEYMSAVDWSSRVSFSFIVQSLRQSFGNLDPKTENIELWAATLAAAVGVWFSWRKYRRETIALLSFLAIYVAIHIAYAIDKPRFVHPVAWIPVLYALFGAQEIVRRIRARISVGPRLRWKILLWLLAGAAVCLALLSLRAAFSDVLRPHGVLPPWSYGVLLGVVLAVVACSAAIACRRSPAVAVLTCAVLLGLLAPTAASGLTVQARSSWRVYYQHIDHYLMAKWLSENMKPGERALVLSTSVVRFARPFEPGAIREYHELRAQTEAELEKEIQGLGITYIAYSYRKPAEWWGGPGSPRYQIEKTELLSQFRDGKDHAHFRHVATLPLPPRLKNPPVQIYRFVPPSAPPPAP